MAEFVCEHPHYRLGDRHDVDECADDLFARYCPDMDGDGMGTAEKLRKVAQTDNIVWFPISIYDHSGLSMWLGGTAGHPDARWDCSMVGFAYINKQAAESAGFPSDWQHRARQAIEEEMKVYSAYLEGDVYYYTIIDPDEQIMGSGGGFYGSDSMPDLIKEAKAYVDTLLARIEEERKKHLSFVREHLADICGRMWITNGYVYMVGPDMYGLPEFSRAKATPNTDLSFSHINLQDLPHKALSCLVHFVSKP